MTEKKWLVHCKYEEDVTEWVYAEDAESAMEVIRDNFFQLKPCYAAEIKPKETKYYMGFEYDI